MVLIPAILLVAFGVAVFLIWAGIKLSPVSWKDRENTYGYADSGNGPKSGFFQEETFSGGSSNRPARNQIRKESGIANVSETGGEENTSNSDSGDRQSGSKGIKEADNLNQSGGDAAGNANPADSGTKDKNSGKNNQSDNKASQNINNNSNQTTNNNSNPSGSSAYESGPGGCTFPKGNINVWWHSATKRQRDCYISVYGQPDLSASLPYFCGYEKSEDCYYK